MRWGAMAAMWIWMACGSALAKEPERVMDPFTRQRLRLEAFHDAAARRTQLRLVGRKAVYPSGTQLRLGVRYLQSLSTAKHPFGDPAKTAIDGSRKRVIDGAATVGRDRTFTAVLKGKRYLPPGEYVLTSTFMLEGQKRKVRREYLRDYVPRKERNNPCNFCRFHFGLSKVALSDPTFVLRPAFARMKGELWQKQRADYRDRIATRYAAWEAELRGARRELLTASQRLLGCGPRAIELLQRPAAGARPAEQALARLRALSGLVEGRRALLILDGLRRPGVAATARQRWRLVMRGERPRLQRVLAAMRQHRDAVQVLIDPHRFTALWEAAQALLAQANRLDALGSAALDRGPRLALLARVEAAQGPARQALLRQVQVRWEGLAERLRHCHQVERRARAALRACAAKAPR